MQTPPWSACFYFLSFPMEMGLLSPKTRNSSETLLMNGHTIGEDNSDLQTCLRGRSPSLKRQASTSPETAETSYHGDALALELSSDQMSLTTDWWLWELLASLLSVATFSAVSIVLLQFDDKALPKLPRYITVGSIERLTSWLLT